MSADAPRDPSRRRFLIGSAAAGGTLLVGTQLPGCASGTGSTSAEGEWVADACLRIGPGGIRVLVPHTEMGQGVMTSLAMLVAEELEVDLDQVSLELAPAERAFDHPSWGVQLTGGSTSVRARFDPLREVGAVARTLLLRAGAERLGVDLAACRAERGEIVCDAKQARLPYAELAPAAARLPVPDDVALKPPEAFRLIGTRAPRPELPARVRGEAIYGIDVSLPGLRIASVERAPRFGATVERFDATRARAVPGVRHVVRISSGVAVVADRYWNAVKGRRALDVEWSPGPNAGQGSAEIRAAYRELAAGPGDAVRDEGDARAALASAAEVFEATYELPYLAHATLEPMNATAHVRADGCDVWAPTQNPGLARDVAVALTGLPYERVRVQPTQIGGGFGRRVDVDYVAEAVEVSAAVGEPVKVVWSREDDMQHDFYRPATHHVLRAALDASGVASAWHHRLVGPSISARVVPAMAPAVLPSGAPRFVKRMASGVARWIARGTDSSLVEGAEGIPYGFPNLRVEAATHEDSFVPVGYWRSVGHSHNGFVVESFVDELAHRAGRDPYRFRRELLGAAPRHRAVLDAVAERAGWGSPAPAGRHRGIAVHESFGSFVAMVAEVSVSEAREIRVHRVHVAVDCGQVVNPDTIEAQVEGALAFGLSATLEPGTIEIRDGGVVQRNFDGYRVLRLPQMPGVETTILPSREAPGGAGEIGTPPIAPAVANAVFAATGVRLRRLPLELPAPT